MSPLRDKLEQAKKAYGEARYPGNLAADVLGQESPRATGASRRLAAALAIAASLAVGAGVYLVALRSPTTSLPAANERIATNVVTTPQDATVPIAPTDDVLTAEVEEDFTLVPAVASLVGDGASMVPSLWDVMAAEESYSAEAEEDAVSFAHEPMSLMLLSVDDYAANEPTTQEVPGKSDASASEE